MKQEEPPYGGQFAELYDVFYASKPYKEEAGFVHRCIGEYGQGESRKMLELACGTGRHAIHFAELGYQVTAIDSSPEMLARAKGAAKDDSKIEFKELDMRDIARIAGSYDVVVCLFDSIGYVQTDAGLDTVFSGIRARLRHAGLFIFEFWHAPAMLRAYDPVRARRLPIEGGTIIRISQTTVDPKLSLAEVTYDFYELKDDGTYNTIVEKHVNRFFTLGEIESFAARHHFSRCAFHAGFQAEAGISDQTWHVLAILKKE